jgi:hypothetical protein
MSEEEDEYGFDREQFEPIVKQAIDDTLLKETFDESRTQMLVDLICERVLGGVGALGLPMKFVGKKVDTYIHFIYIYIYLILILP